MSGPVVAIVCTLSGVGAGWFTTEPAGHTERYVVESMQHCDDVAREKRTSGKFTTVIYESDRSFFRIICGENGRDCPVVKR